MPDIIISTIPTTVGPLTAGVYDNRLCLLNWKERKNVQRIQNRLTSRFKASFVEGEHPVLALVNKQLDEYFAGTRRDFDIPLCFSGTAFQESVWKCLMNIPYGQTVSYKQQAQMLGKESAIRAVAGANSQNCISIIVPCHRVVGSNGNMVGYAGGVDRKMRLLEIERAIPIESSCFAPQLVLV